MMFGRTLHETSERLTTILSYQQAMDAMFSSFCGNVERFMDEQIKKATCGKNVQLEQMSEHNTAQLNFAGRVYIIQLLSNFTAHRMIEGELIFRRKSFDCDGKAAISEVGRITIDQFGSSETRSENGGRLDISDYVYSAELVMKWLESDFYESSDADAK